MLKNVFTDRKRYLYVKKMLKNDGTIALCIRNPYSMTF